MIDYITIGSSPASEDCAQLGSDDYGPRSKAEINALKNQMVRIVGEPPIGTCLKRRAFPHDFGTYHELVVVYNDTNEEAEDFAFKCETELPDRWDEQARKELAEAGFPVPDQD